MPPTTTRLDWLSFTLEVNAFLTEGVSVIAASELVRLINRELDGALTLTTPSVGRGRFPYKHSTDGDGWRVFWSPGQVEVLVEIEGTGCAQLEASGQMHGLVERVIDRLTRVDIATDIQTETTPQDFTENRTNKRQRSYETAVSSTGTTVYIGSRKSDRYCRVYRYAEPHPRADRLRIECVYRGHQAVALARTWLEHGNEETAARAGNQYGWVHKDWEPHSEETIKAWRPDRKTHSRMHWYKRQVKPALRGLVAHGHLSPVELLDDLLTLTEEQKTAIINLLGDGSVGGASAE